MSYAKVQFLLISIFLTFSVCNLFKSDLESINLILGSFRYVVSAYFTGYLILTYIEKLISTIGNFLATFSLLIWVECCIFSGISIMKNIWDMSKRSSTVYVWRLLVFEFMESSILTIKSSLQILQFILGYLILLGSVDIGGRMKVVLLESWILNLAQFSDVFFLTYKWYMPDLYIIPYFAHEQCFLWAFLVLTITKMQF